MSSKQQIINYVTRWKEKKIINSYQKDLILQDIESETPTNSFFKIIATIGSLFIGLGIILVIASNWENLPKILKLILILLMPTSFLGCGYYLTSILQEYKKIGDSFILLGTLLIGASISLLGQLYNLDGSVSGLLMWWFILTISITFLFKYKTLSAVTISLFYLTIFYFIADNYRIWSSEDLLIQVFTIVPAILIILSYTLRQSIKTNYEIIQKMFELISLKVLFFTLLFGTIDNDLCLFGESLISEIVQNIMFLSTVFYVMWFSNKKYYTILRNSTFFWLGAYMIIKFFSWFVDLMDSGISFILFGIFLLLLVYGYIKGTKYLDSLKQEIKKETINNYEKEIKIKKNE